MANKKKKRYNNSTPDYFKQFPDVDYALRVNSAGKSKNIKIKDYFRLTRVRDDIFSESTLYTEYIVKNGERPDQISYNIYGSEKYYWIILQVNDIVDYYNEWPLSQQELEKYIIDKYGSEQEAGGIHHWETVEVQLDDGSVVLPDGLVVPEDFKFTYTPDPEQLIYLSSFPVAVTNREYEKRLNDDKENIVILDEKYLDDYVREVKLYAKNLPGEKSEVDIYDAFGGY